MRGSAEALGQGHDDPLRPAHVGHPPAVLVLADTADEPVAVGGQLVEGRLEVVDLEGHVAQAELVGHRGRGPGLVVGSDEARELEPVPPPGGRSMTISLRESGMPVTVSTKSPSTNVRPSTSRPSPTKNAVTDVEVCDGDADMVETLYVWHGLLPGRREELNQGVGHPVPAGALATRAGQAELQVRGQRHLHDPWRDLTDPGGDLLAEGQHHPPGGEDQDASRRICGEVLHPGTPRRLLERRDRLPGARQEGHRRLATCAHLITILGKGLRG